MFLHLRMVSIYYSWLNSSAEIIKRYKGEQPLAGWLKQWFSANKKYGSRDRRQIGTLCYRYFRLGKWSQTAPVAVQEKILLAELLCEKENSLVITALKPEWLPIISASVAEKIAFLQKNGIHIAPADFFPWGNQLSEEVAAEQFATSFLQQPDLFIRVRPGYTESVKKKLEEHQVHFTMHSDACIALSNSTAIQQQLVINKEIVIQDYNSQNIASFLREVNIEGPDTWDCCAASGGKSILAADTLIRPRLTVSDIRPSILANLKKRFAEAGIKQYQALQLNLAFPPPRLPGAPFDLIICDAPCTGSGTWSRTPEQLYFFEEKTIASFNELQQKIAGNALSLLKPNGYFLYITCSVFREENETVVRHLQERYGLELLKMELLRGYDKRADTMFGALFINRSPK